MDEQKRVSIVVSQCSFEAGMEATILASTASGFVDKVDLFFTFWGIKMITKGYKPKLQGLMAPFTFIMRSKMKKQGVLSFDEMMQTCRDLGVEFHACSTSMDLMGIKKEDLIEGAKISGASTFLAGAIGSEMQLFIG
jgi:peroxiredoxin family protein